MIAAGWAESGQSNASDIPSLLSENDFPLTPSGAADMQSNAPEIRVQYLGLLIREKATLSAIRDSAPFDRSKPLSHSRPPHQLNEPSVES
jgi:hypothetical protein